MKQYRYLLLLATILLAVGLACNALSGGSSPVATNPPVQPNPPSNNGNPPQQSSGNSDLVTFVDENNLLAFDLPADWAYEHSTGDVYYVDTFTSPDSVAKIESLVYNDGQSFTGGQNGRFALGLLHQFYSSTGEEGDIRVTDDSIQQDGSERLTWESKAGGYSGVSFFETRGDGNRDFLMFTAWWLNDADQATIDTVNNAISSYYIP